MSNFRPLQPAPAEQLDAPLQKSKPLISQKPKRTVTLGACVACRKRKSKCDGTRPICTCCTQKETNCVYELGPNEKPSQAMKRKNEEMQGELSNLRQVYDFLRLRPEGEAQEILRRIRTTPAGVSPFQRTQELAEFIRHGDLLIQPLLSSRSSSTSEDLTLPPIRLALDPSSPGFSRPSSIQANVPDVFFKGFEGPPSQRRKYDAGVFAGLPEHIAPTTSVSPRRPGEPTSPGLEPQIVLERPDSKLATARYWTTVTDNEAVLSHLMSMWHTWEHSYYHFFDWEIFLEDMVAGRPTFCSSFLVNALLASACSTTPLIKDRSKPFADNIMTAFYDEARRLWHVEDGQDTLPRQQGAMLLFLVMSKNGRDKVGQNFLAESCRIARDLGMFRLASSPLLERPENVSEAKWDSARAVSAWALFNFQLSMAFTYSFPPLVRSQPPISIPYKDCDESKALFRSECKRHVVMLDCANLLFDPDGLGEEFPPRPEHVEVLYLRLNAWWDSRPILLDLQTNHEPANLVAIMNYHCIIIRLVRAFLDSDSSLERIKSYCKRAQEIASNSLRELRRLLAIQESQHGWNSCIGFVLHALVITGFGCFEEIGISAASTIMEDLGEPYRGLITCINGLRALSDVIYYAQPLFRILMQASQTLSIDLPSEAKSIFDQYRSEEWTHKAATVIKSQYIADISKTAQITSRTDHARMDAIVKQWDQLTLEDGDASVVEDAEKVRLQQPTPTSRPSISGHSIASILHPVASSSTSICSRGPLR